MPAGEGPFEENGKAEGPAVEETRQIKEGKTVHKDLTEVPFCSRITLFVFLP